MTDTIRRRNSRRHRRLQLRFRPTDSNDKFSTGFTEDIAAQGLFVNSPYLVRPGTRVMIEIDIDDGVLSVTGKVRWAKRSPAGLLRDKRNGMGIALDQECWKLLEIFRS